MSYEDLVRLAADLRCRWIRPYRIFARFEPNSVFAPYCAA